MTDKEPKKNFYFRGKFFETEAEFWEYVIKWDSQPVDMEWFKKHLDDCYNMLKMNVDARPEGSLSNKTAMTLVKIHFGLGME